LENVIHYTINSIRIIEDSENSNPEKGNVERKIEHVIHEIGHEHFQELYNALKNNKFEEKIENTFHVMKFSKSSISCIDRLGTLSYILASNSKQELANQLRSFIGKGSDNQNTLGKIDQAQVLVSLLD
jgi:hypothetical protein